MSTSLSDYISQAQKAGFTNDKISQELLKAGWSSEEVNLALGNNLPVPPPPSPKPQMSSLWDSFEHIIFFISMYVFFISLGLTLHLYVDKFFPNKTDYSNSYSFSWRTSMLKGYLSSLIVSYPIYLFLFLKITKKSLSNPHLTQLSSRKKLTYLTLIVTFIISLASIISVVSQLINGNITSNFILHFLVTISISTSTFIYYLNQVKSDRELKTQ